MALAYAWSALDVWGVSGAGDANAFFAALKDVKLTRWATSEVAKHRDYLADKLGESPETAAFAPDECPFLHDALRNIGSVLLEASGLPEDFLALLKEFQTLPGWCSPSKAVALARLVVLERPEVCVELGVFGGRSLLPCAAALRLVGRGVIHGVDAWSADASTEHATNEANDDWWRDVPYADVKRQFLEAVERHGLQAQVRVVEARSQDVAETFAAIDFLHVDGGHAEAAALQDVELYLAKVRAGGIVVLDDAAWPSVRRAREALEAACDTLRCVDDGEISWAVFRKRHQT
jgi:Methyltransferase domain